MFSRTPAFSTSLAHERLSLAFTLIRGCKATVASQVARRSRASEEREEVASTPGPVVQQQRAHHRVEASLSSSLTHHAAMTESCATARSRRFEALLRLSHGLMGGPTQAKKVAATLSFSSCFQRRSRRHERILEQQTSNTRTSNLVIYNKLPCPAGATYAAEPAATIQCTRATPSALRARTQHATASTSSETALQGVAAGACPQLLRVASWKPVQELTLVPKSCLLLCCGPLAGSESTCALYGVCRPPGGDAFTPRSVNCANALGAVPPRMPLFNLSVCPEYQSSACCDETQVRKREARSAGRSGAESDVVAARRVAGEPGARSHALRPLPRVRGRLPSSLVRVHVLAASGVVCACDCKQSLRRHDAPGCRGCGGRGALRRGA